MMAERPAIELRVLDERLRKWGLPAYQSEMAAAVDLHACIDSRAALSPSASPVLISTGIAMHIADPALAAIVLPRSGLGHRDGLVLGNLLGLIDADYTGPVMVSAWNRNPPGAPPLIIEPGQRFAQMMFIPVVRPAFKVVEAFSVSSARGTGGFGSTDAREPVSREASRD
ncbi:MAG: dUTP diphosphatase [Acetobacteraceae bacterium]|nr:dUTP diphosphatase [Acetobacteraceae bacterium]